MAKSTRKRRTQRTARTDRASHGARGNVRAAKRAASGKKRKARKASGARRHGKVRTANVTRASRASRADAAAAEAVHWQHVRTALRDRGLLLLADARLPSVAGIVAGAPVRGSWWSHPQGRAIFAAARHLHEHPDVLACALLDGKITFVHRRLWPALLAVALAGEAWQTHGLSPAGRALRAQVRRRGEVDGAGAAARELERRLLVQGAEVHTASGRHRKRLRTWERWRQDAGLAAAPAVPPEHARRLLEEAAAGLGGPPAADALPWRARGTRAAPRARTGSG